MQGSGLVRTIQALHMGATRSWRWQTFLFSDPFSLHPTHLELVQRPSGIPLGCLPDCREEDLGHGLVEADGLTCSTAMLALEGRRRGVGWDLAPGKVSAIRFRGPHFPMLGLWNCASVRLQPRPHTDVSTGERSFPALTCTRVRRACWKTIFLFKGLSVDSHSG